MDIEDKERMGSCKEGARKNHCVAVQIEDLMKAVGRLNSKEAAGMDGVPGIIIKLIFKHRAHDVLNMINFIYEKGKIPRIASIHLHIGPSVSYLQ